MINKDVQLYLGVLLTSDYPTLAQSFTPGVVACLWHLSPPWSQHHSGMSAWHQQGGVASTQMHVSSKRRGAHGEVHGQDLYFSARTPLEGNGQDHGL